MEGNAEKAVRGSSHSIPIRGNKALTTSLFFEKALQRFFLADISDNALSG